MLSALLVCLGTVAVVYGDIKSINEADACVKAHNAKRALHRETSPVSWDPSLAAGAQAYAEKLARMGRLQHSRGQYGENLYMAGGWGNPATCSKAVDAWYGEISKYNWNRPGFTYGTGHFTQVVWKESNQIGVGIAYNTNTKATYIVARYTPAGNMMGAFKENVMPLKDGTGTGTGTGTGNKCKDGNDSYCRRYQNWCRRSQRVAKYCPKTCNKC